MIETINRNRKIIIFSISFFMISFLTVFTKNVKLMNYYTFLAFFPFVLLTSIYIFFNWKTISSNIALMIWFVFLCVLLLSELQNGAIMDSLILYAITGIFIMSSIKVREVLLSLIIGIFPIILVAFVAAVLGNKFTSNSVGISVSLFLVSVQLYFSLNFKYFKKISLSIIVFLILNIISFWVLFKINSRTAILISSVSVVILILHIIFSYRKNIVGTIEKSSRSLKIFYVIIMLLTAIILFFIVFKSISNIFTPKWRPDDISTGRFDIWLTTIENRELFGHKYDWYTTSGLFGEHNGPHNMLIGVLAFGGTASLVVFIGVLFYCFIKLIKRYLKNPSILNLTLLSMLALSNIKGLTESLILQSSYQLYNVFFIVPIVFLNKDNEENFNLKKEFKYQKLLLASALIFVLVMLVNIYGSVFDFKLNNVVNLVKKYV